MGLGTQYFKWYQLVMRKICIHNGCTVVTEQLRIKDAMDPVLYMRKALHVWLSGCLSVLLVPAADRAKNEVFPLNKYMPTVQVSLQEFPEFSAIQYII